jgi:hypothetical protein
MSASKDLQGARLLTPRPHQLAARDAILAARREDRPGFLLGDLTGLGKTLSVWAALAQMPEDEILIVCPKGGLPQWRRTMALSGLGAKKVTLINYERTKSLFAPPAASTKRSVRAKNNELARSGRPKRTWPVVVFDESHRLRNPYTQQSMACRQLAERASFTIYMSATAGQSPHELSYLGRLLGRAAGCPTETLADYRVLMKALGIGRAKGRWTNWSWEPNERDRTLMSDLLYRGPRAIGLRRRPGDISGWPEVQRELATTALAPDDRRLYDATWREFRREFGLAGGSTRRATGWAADLRFRQKASLLRVDGTAAFADDLLCGRRASRDLGRVSRDERAPGRDAATSTLACLRDQRPGQRRGQRGSPHRLPDRRVRRRGLHRHGIHLAPSRRDARRRQYRSLVVHDMRHSAIQLQQIEGAATGTDSMQ